LDRLKQRRGNSIAACHQAFAALDFAVHSTDVIIGLDQSIAQGLVIAFPVVVIQIAAHSPTE
jgi:hypothetical protein